jgi:aspartyl-tRNA(Asn)/glutamyl-tRNA(Gln) amidotransferase subunit A
MDDPTSSSLSDLAHAVRARKVGPVELTRAYLDRIARLDPTLHAFITVDAEGALTAAAGLEREAAAGAWRGPFHGVPLAHKDLCLIPGLPTSCGTRTSDYFVGAPPCTAVVRLQAAGALTLGKLNMTELALGPFGDNAHHGDVQNPWRIGHVSGGSSSGSGAAVAAGLAAGALGTDTGGSIRLRGGGAQAHLRAREPGGGDAALLVLRPRGSARPHCARRGADAGRDRGRRSA